MEASEYPVQDIPQCLIETDRWVAWRTIMRGDRPTKVPIDARTGAFASVSEPKTWCPFEIAFAAFGDHGDWDGLGIVFTDEDSLAGVDLDDCLDESGQFIWGQDIVQGLNTYTEISPSGRGLKLFLRGAKPKSGGSRRDGFGPLGIGKVEVYDQGRFFAVTGRPMHGFPNTVENRHADFEAMCDWLWPAATSTGDRGEIPKTQANDHRKSCLDALLAMKVADHNDGSHRLFAACCRCVEHDLNDQEALETIRAYEESVPFPIHWSDTKILKRIRDAENRCTRGEAIDSAPGNLGALPAPLPVAELVDRHPKLRTPIIDGLLREGETMNVIAPPKAGKSWLVTDLALSIATGQPWLGTFQTRQGNVLLLDNELHAETSADRIPRVAEARNVRISDTRESLFIDNLRGRLLDFVRLRSYFDQLAVGFFKVIIMDAFYRFLPKDTDENSNGNLTDIYNLIDQYADQLGCSFVLVHHASKGNQASKSVTDVGAGAGSQSRATDTHLVLRQHQTPGCVVVDAAVRSWPPLESRCLRWEFPLWHPDEDLDPAELKLERPIGRRGSKEKSEKTEWTAESFAKKFVTEKPAKMMLVRSEASKAGISQRLIKELQEEAEQQELVFRWKSGANQPTSLASVPQPEEVTE